MKPSTCTPAQSMICRIKGLSIPKQSKLLTFEVRGEWCGNTARVEFFLYLALAKLFCKTISRLLETHIMKLILHKIFVWFTGLHFHTQSLFPADQFHFRTEKMY